MYPLYVLVYLLLYKSFRKNLSYTLFCKIHSWLLIILKSLQTLLTKKPKITVNLRYCYFSHSAWGKTSYVQSDSKMTRLVCDCELNSINSESKILWFYDDNWLYIDFRVLHATYIQQPSSLIIGLYHWFTDGLCVSKSVTLISWKKGQEMGRSPKIIL